MQIARKFILHIGGGVIIIAVASSLLFLYGLDLRLKDRENTLASPLSVNEILSEEINYLVIIAGVIMLASLVAFFIQLALFSRRIAKPLKEAVSFSNALAKGDFSARLTPDEKGRDEVSDLIRALNHMKDRMQNSIMKLEKSNMREQTARKEAESANLFKSDFMTNISLEFRNPLNSIMGLSSLIIKEIERGRYDDGLKTKAEAMLRASETLNSLITNMLELSRMDSKRVEVNVREFETASLIKDVVNYQLIAAEEKNISLESHYSAETPAVIMTDRDILFQILCSITSCMIKTARQEETVSIGCEKEDGKIVIWLKGSHTSDAPSLAEIFNRHKNYKSGEMPSFSGTTILSMVISKANAGLLGAEMEALDDAANNECVFRLSFNEDDLTPKEIIKMTSTHYATNTRMNIQFDKQPDDKTSGRRREKPPAKQGKDKFAVLLADDNDSNRFLIELMLKDSEFDIDSVSEGISCLEAMAKKKYDVLILDLQMPNMDGYSVLERIRRDATLKDTPIIVVSAYIEEKDKSKLYSMGADECLLKPLSMEQVMKSLRKMVGRKG